MPCRPAVILGPPVVFAASSISNPSHAACSQTRRRISAACSPMPAVKTSASRPPSAAASERPAPGKCGRRKDRLLLSRADRLLASSQRIASPPAPGSRPIREGHPKKRPASTHTAMCSADLASRCPSNPSEMNELAKHSNSRAPDVTIATLVRILMVQEPWPWFRVS